MIKILLSNGGGLEAGKEIMRLIGLDCGEVRLPMRPLDASAKTRLKANLDELGFFEAIQR
jgi:N-acetylneuraminate lyase